MFIAQVLVRPSMREQLKQISQIEHIVSWLFTSVAQDLCYRETNPGSGQSKTWTWDRWIASPTR